MLGKDVCMYSFTKGRRETGVFIPVSQVRSVVVVVFFFFFKIKFAIQSDWQLSW